MAELFHNSLFLDANLKAYYRFNSGALTTDSKGVYTLTNNNTVGESAAGKFNYCADFGSSNTNKYLNILNDIGINTGAITISCWVKMNTELASSECTFVWKGSATNYCGYAIEYRYNGGSRLLSITRYLGGVGGTNITSSFTAGTSNWHLLTLTYNGTTLKGYIDGVETCSGAASGNGTSDYINSLSIGARKYNSGNADNYSSSLIDDVSIFNRALTADEILRLYKTGFTPKTNFFM